MCQPALVPVRYRRLRVFIPDDTSVCGLIGKPVDLDMYLRNPFIRRDFEEERRRACGEHMNILWARSTGEAWT